MKKIITDEGQFKIDAKQLSLKEMAIKYNMKSCTVSKWKHILNTLTVPKNIPLPNKEQFAKDLKLYSNVVLAEKYGVGLRLISKWRKQLGLANIWHKEIVNWIRFDKDVKIMRWYELTRKYGASWSVIKKWKKERGLTTGKKENRQITWVMLENGCWECTSHKVDNRGYVTCKDDRLVAIRMWSSIYGEWPKGAHCLHSCDNTSCINPYHVRPGTPQANSAEMAERNRSPWGNRNGVRKLNSDQAKKIFELRDSGRSTRDVAKEFGISGSNVWNIWHEVTWWRDNQGMQNFPIYLISGNEVQK
jgi:hypothetical protein